MSIAVLKKPYACSNVKLETSGNTSNLILALIAYTNITGACSSICELLTKSISET